MDLSALTKRLKETPSLSLKLLILEGTEEVKGYLTNTPEARDLIDRFGEEEQIVLYSLILLGEADLVFPPIWREKGGIEELYKLLQELVQVERFYTEMGGLLGYIVTFLQVVKREENVEEKGWNFEPPIGHNFCEGENTHHSLTLQGIEGLGLLAEIYPVGGAGDRLDLHDSETKEPLPTAKLPFMGRTLLEGLFRDLQAREYLYFKLFGRQLQTPVALMTSQEKHNHYHIARICDEQHWFHRDRSRLFLCNQPLAPVVTEEGRLSFSAPLRLNLKPGGHGVIWKLAIELGIFEEFKRLGVRKALLRQINNPIAGTDDGILAFLGEGFAKNRLFGFASCERLTHMAEGMLVLMSRKVDDKNEYCLTNIEYTDFKRFGIEDKARSKESLFSIYPSNTNILFADIRAVEKKIKKNPFPGLIVNFKHDFPTVDSEGVVSFQRAGRLETTMQNIADSFIYSYPKALEEDKKGDLPTFITYNSRRRTIATTKKKHLPEGPLEETPEGAYYALLLNSFDLLKKQCNMSLPPIGKMEEILENPPFLFRYHPALGPLYEVIALKVQGGTLAPGSELLLELAEVDIKNLHLEGSLQLLSPMPLGHLDGSNILRYSERAPRLELEEVTVVNAGVDWRRSKPFWMGHFTRRESLEIVLQGNAEFSARQVTFRGSHRIVVPEGHRMTVREVNHKILYELEEIDYPSWHWKYHVTTDGKIVLEKR